MDFYDRKMIEKLMEAAVLFPDLLKGGKLQMPEFEVRLRPSGYYALFVDGVYRCTTHETDLDKATRWMNVHALQWMAEQDAVHDARRISVLAVIEHRKKMAVRDGLAGAVVIASTLEAFADTLDLDETVQLRQLTDDWIEEAEDRFCETYSYEYFHNALKHLRTGIRDFTKKTSGAIYLPFDLPPAAPGKVKVFSDVELATIRRWSTGEETFVPRKRLWMPPCEALSPVERRDRRLVYRQMFLGMNYGSRSGIYEKLAHEPHDDGGHFDLANAKFHRVPPGTTTHSNKLAPSVDLDTVSVAEFSRWRVEDGDCPWVFPSMLGGPLSYDRQAVIFTSRLAELGIDATGHVLRHSFITAMIRKGMGSSTIASIAGISMRMMHERYDHRDHGPVQALAHGLMGTMF
ncbi:tyrosine-type recombinase/integrase [Bradyrhizobium sp. RT5a]|uniref:tyrosine-type recombinase/integrase n=1 Tax=Bradyrhizobium sp. RT5a TaxID=3156380 RepID=UPI00339B99A7